MPDKLKEYVRQTIDEILAKTPAKERLKGLTPAERLEGLPAEERLKGLPAEERLKGLTADEVLLALSPATREAVARRLKANGSTEEGSPDPGRS